MRKAIVVGASSGIGRELVKVLSKNEYIVGMVARRVKLLAELQDEIHAKSYIKQIDISQVNEATVRLSDLIEEMDGVDVVILSAGVYHENPELDWNLDREIIDTNVVGFCAVANVFYKYFQKKDSGHIVGISSIASHRGSYLIPSYSASKAFVSNYLEGLQKRVRKMGLNVLVTNIEPDYVDTPMIKGVETRVSPILAEDAALQVYDAIQEKKDHVYVTKQWHLIVWLRRAMPRWLYRNFRP